MVTSADPPLLDAAGLRDLAAATEGAAPCATCAPLTRSAGWEALPGTFDSRDLRLTGTLRDPAADDPTLEEHHPNGTNAWSADAPIAPAWFPYNRCEVWQCRACDRPFLRYTEYGGYYHEHRIRPLQAGLVTD